MARPVNADAEATRRRILESALQLFSGHGIGGTSIREIARAADVSLAMVHHYFGSKDDLYSACIDSMYGELGGLRSELETSLMRGASLSDGLEHAVRAGFRFARTHQTAVRLLLRSVVEAGELDEQRRETMQAPFLNTISQALSGLLNQSPRELRFTLQSVVFLTARYSISSDRELQLFSGIPADGVITSEEAVQAAEEHLVRVTRALLGETHDLTIQRKKNAN